MHDDAMRVVVTSSGVTLSMGVSTARVLVGLLSLGGAAIVGLERTRQVKAQLLAGEHNLVEEMENINDMISALVQSINEATATAG